jgi:hypothetical protein
MMLFPAWILYYCTDTSSKLPQYNCHRLVSPRQITIPVWQVRADSLMWVIGAVQITSITKKQFTNSQKCIQ